MTKLSFYNIYLALTKTHEKKNRRRQLENEFETRTGRAIT